MIEELEPYPDYQPVRSRWITRAPAHWEVRKLRTLIVPSNQRGRPDLPLLSVARERGVFVRTETDDNHNVIPEDLSNYKVARAGSLVINKMKAWQGSMGIAPCDGIVSPAYFVYDLRVANRGFGQALLRSRPYVAHFAQASDGVRVGQWDLSIHGMREIPVVLPPPDEQAAIVRFLDHANRRIDRFIRAKKQLIALLNEQKQAVIHRAVTGEPAPQHDLVPTGSRWFPRLPRGWQALTLRRVISAAIDGPHFSPSYVDAGIPFLSARNIKADGWSLDDAKFITAEDYREFSRRVRPEPGDVLYTKGGTTGVARAVDLAFPFQVWVHVAVLKLIKERIVPEYLAYALNSPRCFEQSQLFTRGATNQDLGLGRMKQIHIPVPDSLAQQRAIVEGLDRSTLHLRQAITRAEREILLIREYRARLVADIVTGQLDVRAAAASLPTVEPAEVSELGAEDDPGDGEQDGTEEGTEEGEAA